MATTPQMQLDLRNREIELLKKQIKGMQDRIETLQKAQRWISVTERLPEERGAGVGYLVTLKSAKWPDMVMQADFIDGQFHRIAGDLGPISNVSHWMPMPAPPIAT